MAILKFHAEDVREPLDSSRITVRNENADDCYGEMCGSYHEHEGRPLKPSKHSHLVLKGHDPETTERYYRISK